MDRLSACKTYLGNMLSLTAMRRGGISPKKRGRLLRFPQGRDFPEKTGQAATLPAGAGFPRKNGAGCYASRKGGISPKKRGRLLRFPQGRDFATLNILLFQSFSPSLQFNIT